MIFRVTIFWLMLIAAGAPAQDWGSRFWLGTSVSIEQAVQQISESEQREWLYYLASPELDGRKPNTAGYQKAVAYIEARCKMWGLKTERQTVPSRDQNLIAWLPGKSNEIVVVCAHLDHLGGGIVGADDNASGSVAVMATAKAFTQIDQPPRTMVFQWYTAEESGLLGSAYYVANPTRGPLANHKFAINADMVGRLGAAMIDETDYATIEQEELTVDISAIVKRLATTYSFASRITKTGGTSSDHYSWTKYGIKNIWAFTGTHGDYHTKRDTPDKIDFPGLRRVSQYMTEFAWIVATELPTYEPVEQATDQPIEMRRIGGEPFTDSGN